MSGRIAYLTLVKGRLPGQIRWKSIHKQHAAMFWPLAGLQKSDLFNSEQLNNILAARRHVRNIETQIIDGYLCFDSIYDLMLHLELDLKIETEGQPSSIYRGHQEHDWELVPSLYREPDKIESEIERTILMISDLLDKEPPFLTYDPLEILAVAQHYGAKTCLLDFTHDPTIAATFACIDYKPDLDTKYGAIYYYPEDEARSYCRGMNLAAGSVISIDLRGVYRIERQKGLFIGAFNKDALKSVLGTDRYLFIHGIDSLTFPRDTGLTLKYLFPQNLSIPKTERRASQKRKEAKKNIVDEIRSILCQWVVKLTNDLSWEDCYNISLCFVRSQSSLNEQQLRRMRIFSRWFADLQKLSLPGDIKSMTRLHWATKVIEHYYQVSDEVEDIMSRLDRTPSTNIRKKVHSLLNRARKAEGYNPEIDGSYLFWEDKHGV